MRTTAQISRLRRAPRFPIAVEPTGLDVAISRAIARHTSPAPEEIARALTWGADEKLLLVLASVGWLASRGRGEPLRRAGNHALLRHCRCVAASSRVETPVRPDPPGPQNGDRTRPRHCFLGQARRMRFPRVTPCTWARWHPRPARCRPALGGRSGRSRSGSR